MSVVPLHKQSGIVLAIVLLLGTSLYSQVNFGADVVSRYVWRGLDFGDAPGVQPTLEYSHNGLTIGTWASYPLTVDPLSNEHDIYASYLIGSFTLGMTDYYYPGTGADVFSRESHVIEASLSYSGLVSLLVAANILNDNDNSIYIETGYESVVEDVNINFFVGGTAGASDWYAATKAGFLALGVTANKDIYNVSFVLNPLHKTTYLIFGIGL